MTTKEMIEVMQAYDRGEEIERRSANCEGEWTFVNLSLIHISEPTRPY
mgnify:CR=1 FL=1